MILRETCSGATRRIFEMTGRTSAANRRAGTGSEGD